MKMVIDFIHLVNFKGIEHLMLDFNEGVTNISGKNGIGKSTIADAISWCLFGKDSHGNTTFGLKTRGEDGKEIPHLEHYVSINMNLDGKEKNLTRTLKEKWSKPRGSEEEILTGNVIKYSIDGEECTKADYDKFVFAIAGTDLFPLLSTPNAFSDLHWTKQREILSSIVGELTEEDVTGGDPRYEELLAELKEQSLEAYRKHLSYSIKELKKSIDEMPVKISTLKETLPDVTLSADELKSNIAFITDQLSVVNQKIVSVKAGASELFASQAIKKDYDFTQRRMMNIETSKRNQARDLAEQHDAEVRDSYNILVDVKDNHNSLVAKRQSVNLIIDECDKAIEEIETKLAMGSADWKALTAEKFEFDNSLTICPTCGRELPAEQAQEVYDKAKATFNRAKAEKKAKFLADAESLKKELEQAKQTKQENIDMLSVVDEQVVASKEALRQAEDKYNKVKGETSPTAIMLLNDDKVYQELKAKVQDYEKQMEEPTATTSATADLLDNEAKNLQAKLDEQKKLLSDHEHYEKIMGLIDDTKNKWQTLNKELTQLEQREDLAIEYSNRKDAVLESKVNSQFKFVKFKLFRTLVNGIDREPFCTATYQGVEYKDINSAMKINVGLDIINTLSKFYDTYVPVLIDNAEGSNMIESTESQQIRLYVTNDNKLTIS